MNNTMNKVNNMELINVCGGTDYDFEVPVIKLEYLGEGETNEDYGGGTPGTGEVTIITKEEKDEAMTNYASRIGWNLVNRTVGIPPYEYYLNEVLKKHGKSLPGYKLG